MATDATHLDGLPAAIPLSVLFGNSDKRMPRISPDGKYYAYLADDANGVANVFVKPVQLDTTGTRALVVDAAAQQVTTETHRLLRSFMWSKSTTRYRILYAQDTDGDENYHLYVVDFEMDASHKAHHVVVRDVTPFGPVMVTLSSVNLSGKYPDLATIPLNKRDAGLFDACKLDLNTGEVEVLIENPGNVMGWLANDDLEVVASFSMDHADGSLVLRIPTSPAMQKSPSEWKTIARWPHGEISEVHSLSADGKALYVETSLRHTGDGSTGELTGTNTSRLVLLSMEDGKELEVITQDDTCDISSVVFNEETRTPLYAVFKYTKPRVQVLDEEARDDLEHVVSLVTGEFTLVSTSKDFQTWMYSDGPDNASLKYYIYDRATKKHALLFDSRPELAKYTLVEMTPQVIKTSDGEDMVGYLSLPHGVKHEKLPFVLYVHGGPWERDVWGYNAAHQHLANRGYGCLSVNFRGSTGYGKRWTNLGDRQWGANMQQDLTDAVHWAIQQGLADPARVAIYGGSYGGYATLAGLAFTPDLYACGVDIVGPSNVKTMLESFPPYWAIMKKMFLLRVGDVENDDEFNRKISPLYHADKITKPLLIAHGANDPRVKQAESDQIAKKLFAGKHEVQYVLYKDEGHGFVQPPNRLDFTWRAEHFLATHLGGRAFPKDEKLVAGNSAVVIDASKL